MELSEITYRGITLDKWLDKIQKLENDKKKEKAEDKKIVDKFTKLHTSLRGK